jgi:hypothetical protein
MRIGALVKYIRNVTSLRDLIKLQSCCFIVGVAIAHICLTISVRMALIPLAIALDPHVKNWVIKRQ